MTSLDRKELQIFLAEDNLADVYLVELALREHNIPFMLRLVKDGEDAIRTVANFGKGEPVPDIAIVDLNLPRFEGGAVMRSIREHGCCERTPLILMSSHRREYNRTLIESFGAVFFEKPPGLNDYMALGALVNKLCGRDGE